MKSTISGFLLFCWVTLISVERSTLYRPPHFPAPLYNLPHSQADSLSIRLGRMLFYDPILSRDSTVSCASCHTSYNSFAHTDHALSHGIHDSIGTRNAPSLINLAWQQNFMWDGAISRLDAQSIAPITHPAEMGSDLETLVNKLNRNTGYKTRFQDAFGSKKIELHDVLLALQSFELTLISAHSRYDSMRLKKCEYTTQEKRGYALFLSYCNSCHTEPLFTNGTFQNNGLEPDTLLKDVGRERITGLQEDRYKFKVPTLRNLEYSYPYMHDGRFKRLSEVLTFYASEKRNSQNLAKSLAHPIPLSGNDRADIVAFLLTLSDRSFVFNPQLAFPRELLLK